MPENTLTLKKQYKIAHSPYSLDYFLFLHAANNKKHHDVKYNIVNQLNFSAK